MKTQSLKSACIKSLSKSEIFDQREFNGVKPLKVMLGYEDKAYQANFFNGGNDSAHKVGMKWYDARLAHETRSEFRLYYEGNAVMEAAQVGDNIVIGFDKTNTLTCILYKLNNDEYQGNIPEWKQIK